jgi:chorismate mutase / prephenate dehydratase
MSDIDQIRKNIHSIDIEILRLLEERAALSRDIGLNIKNASTEFNPGEQQALLDEISGDINGIFPKEGLSRVFLEIMSSCQLLEKPFKVAFLGPEGTYTHQASVSTFGSSIEFIPFPNIDDIFSAVEKKKVNFSMVAIENSTGGVVHDVLDRLLNSDVKITAETVLYIHHCLISKLPSEKIKRIFSHPQPFLQCRNFLRENFPDAKHIEVSSTVEGVHRAKESEDGAAIGSEIAAKLNNMKILSSDIQDNSENFTRFVVLGRTLTKPSGDDKTSLILSLKHKPGSLYEAMKPFAERGVNLTKIESRPTRQRPWEYVFFIDFEGHINDEKVQKVLKELEPHTFFVRLLGSYPKAKAIK